MAEFTTAYEYSLSLMFVKLLKTSILPLILLLFNIYILRTINKKGEIDSFINYFNITDPDSQKLVAKISITVFSVILIFIVYSVSQKHIKTYSIIKSQKTSVIEGFVKDFDPMPETGHKYEAFYVDSVKFEFSDYVLGDVGYNNAKSKGGVIDDSLYVRIHYYNFSGINNILKLEIEKKQTQ